MSSDKLNYSTIISPLFAENTYIAHLGDSGACLVIDPGIDPDAILSSLHEQQLKPAAILNTHGHADHIAGNGALKAAFPDCPLIIGAGDAYKLTDPQANLSANYGINLISPEADLLVHEPRETLLGRFGIGSIGYARPLGGTCRVCLSRNWPLGCLWR